MSRKFNKKLVSIFCMVISFTLIFTCTSIAVGLAEPPFEILKKLTGISEEEKEVLKTLFTLSQEISAAEREEKQLADDIETINSEIKDTESAISNEEAAYKKNQEALKKILKSYQRMGPGSFLEIILNSDSLASFLLRLNILRDITRNTGELLGTLKESKGKLTAERSELAAKLAMVEEKQKQSEETLVKMLKLKEENEQYLASLKGEKEYYEKYLAGIQEMLRELKPFFAEAVMEFSQIMNDGSLTRNAVKISFSFFSIKGLIEEKSFNDVISKQPKLSEMTFAFHPDKIEMSLPSENLVLSGKFVILEENKLKLQVEEGSFYGMPLEAGTLDELLEDGDIVIDLKPLLGKYTLKSVHIREGYLELAIR